MSHARPKTLIRNGVRRSDPGVRPSNQSKNQDCGQNSILSHWGSSLDVPGRDCNTHAGSVSEVIGLGSAEEEIRLIGARNAVLSEHGAWCIWAAHP